MRYDSKPTGRAVYLYIFGLAVAGGAVWSLTAFGKEFTALYQLVAILFIAAAVYLLVRYKLTSFSFRIEGKNGGAAEVRTALPEELDLVVERVQGRRGVDLARISLDRLKRADMVKYSELRTASQGTALFKYHANMSPEEGCLLVFSDRERDIAIFAEFSPDIIAFLKKIAAEGGRREI